MNMTEKMEEKSKGLSLRKKRSIRPKISTPKQVTALLNPHSTSTSERPRLLDQGQSASNLSVPRSRSPANGGTADYVKRRYSTRITQLPADSNVPAVPPLPGSYGRGPSPDGRIGINHVGEKVPVDIQALQNPHLRPGEYVAQVLANASEDDIREYQQELGRIKNRASTDLQHSVVQNRTQFIKISQEAEKLKGEMRTLRSLMSDLTNTLGQTNAALGIDVDTSTARKHANRSSVANLEAMWTTHLQELWRRVEGSQKFLPATPGRHVVHESGRWMELNTATWRPRRHAHLVLLNDHLLVATDKKRFDASRPTPGNSKLKPTPSKMQLVAERCWPLHDIEIADIPLQPAPGSGSQGGRKRRHSNAINIRAGAESLTYQATDAEGSEKALFLAKFRKAIADQRKVLQLDVEGNTETLDTNGRSGALNSSRGGRLSMTNGVSTPSRQHMFVEVEGRQQPFRWVDSQIDELDIDIALQRFDEAVDRVDRLRRIAKSNTGNSLLQDMVNGKVQDQAANLAKILLKRMIETNSFMTATQQHVAWLTQLGFEERASEAFLQARSEVVRTRFSQCIDQGDLYQYLYQVSYIFFTLIRNTVSVYQSCFAPVMSSACVKWAKERVDDFNTILGRQVARLDRASEEYKLCLEGAKEHAAMLSEVGFDFRALIGKNLGDGYII